VLSQQDLEGLIAPIILNQYPDRKLDPLSFPELKARFPGLTGLTYHNGNQVLHFGDKEVEVSPMASFAEIEVAISNPFVPTLNTKVSMSVTGLQSGTFQAKLAEMRKRIADSQNAGIAKIDAVVSDGEKKLQEAADGVAKQAQSEVDTALQEFAQTTNGGPPLNG
jgi:hypothetical protein